MIKKKYRKNTYVDLDGLFEILPYMLFVFLLFWVIAIFCIIGAIDTHIIKKNGDMYTIKAEYVHSYVDEKFNIHDIYKTEENDAEIQYVMVYADSDSAGPVFGENMVLTVYKYKSDTLCYVGEKRIKGYDFLSDDMFLLLTEGRRVKTE